MDFGREEYSEQHRFWRVPQVLEKLCEYIDLKSMVALVRSGGIQKEVLKKALPAQAWKNKVDHGGFIIINEFPWYREEREKEKTILTGEISSVLSFIGKDRSFVGPIAEAITKQNKWTGPSLGSSCLAPIKLVVETPGGLIQEITEEGFFILEALHSSLMGGVINLKSISTTNINEDSAHLLNLIIAMVKQQGSKTNLEVNTIDLSEKSMVGPVGELLQLTQNLLIRPGRYNCAELKIKSGEKAPLDWSSIVDMVQTHPGIFTHLTFSEKALTTCRVDQLENLFLNLNPEKAQVVIVDPQDEASFTGSGSDWGRLKLFLEELQEGGSAKMGS